MHEPYFGESVALQGLEFEEGMGVSTMLEHSSGAE